MSEAYKRFLELVVNAKICTICRAYISVFHENYGTPCSCCTSMWRRFLRRFLRSTVRRFLKRV